jgi:ABC-type bacteriocin/lantibiotic exporter with double-glycine peptidase domain
MPRPDPLPDIRQNKDHNCGWAAWQSIYRYHYDRNPSRRDLSNPIHGTDPSTLEAIIRNDRQWTVISGEMFLNDLRHFCETLRPVICTITRTFDDGIDYGHYVAVAGVWRNRVYFQDPTYGPEVWSAEKWMSSWHDMGKYAKFRHWGLVACPKIL